MIKAVVVENPCLMSEASTFGACAGFCFRVIVFRV